jgi:hypothetical protein
VPLIEEVIFSPEYVSESFVKDQMAVAAWFYYEASYSVPLVFVSVFNQFHQAFVTTVL